MYGCKYSSKVDTVTFEEWMTATTFAKSKNTKKIRIFAIAGKGENNNINKKKNFLKTTTSWITIIFYELIFHLSFCTSAAECN